jgi:hypothetical protein
MNEQFTKPINVRPSRTSPQTPLIFENSMATFPGSSDRGDSSALHHGQELRTGNHTDSTAQISPFTFHENTSAFQQYKSPRSNESIRRDELYHPQFSAASTFPSSNEDIRRTPGPRRIGSEDKDHFGPINAFQQGLPFASPLQRALDQHSTGATSSSAESPDLMNIVDRILVGMQDEEYFFPASSDGSENAIVKMPSSEQQFLIDVTESLGGTYSSDVDGISGSDLAYKGRSYMPSSNYLGEEAFSIREFPIDQRGTEGFSFGLDSRQSFRQRDRFSDLTAQISNSWDSADSGYSLGYGRYQEHLPQEQQPHQYQGHTLQFNAQYSRKLPPPPPSLQPLQHDENEHFGTPSTFTVPPRSQSPILSCAGFNPPRHDYSSVSTAGSFHSSKATSCYEDFSGVSKSREDAYESTSLNDINPKWAPSERAFTRKTDASSSQELSSSYDKKADNRKARALPNERLSQESAKAAPIAKPSLEPSETPLMKAASKKFSETLRLKERESLDAAQEYAMKALESMSEGLIWKVYEELADMAKRHDQFDMVNKKFELFLHYHHAYRSY